jgi:hypothetical protein
VGFEIAWQCAGQLYDIYQQVDLTRGRRLAERVIETLPAHHR